MHKQAYCPVPVHAHTQTHRVLCVYSISLTPFFHSPGFDCKGSFSGICSQQSQKKPSPTKSITSSSHGEVNTAQQCPYKSKAPGGPHGVQRGTTEQSPYKSIGQKCKEVSTRSKKPRHEEVNGFKEIQSTHNNGIGNRCFSNPSDCRGRAK